MDVEPHTWLAFLWTLSLPPPHQVFYNPLCSVATDDELSVVFVNWQQLILCNARLFRALYNNSDINSFETVGAVFLEEVGLD